MLELGSEMNRLVISPLLDYHLEAMGGWEGVEVTNTSRESFASYYIQILIDFVFTLGSLNNIMALVGYLTKRF
jgi:hypothetical protein